MRWMWIDRIVEFEPGRRLAAIKHVSLAEEHLHDHFPGQPVMPASLMIEGMAQTAGILVGSVNEFREKVILAKITSAKFDAEVTPGQSIRYEAGIERIDTSGASTSGIVQRCTAASGQWETIGRVDLLFSHLDKAMTNLDIPSHNFVFGENLRAILRQGGLTPP